MRRRCTVAAAVALLLVTTGLTQADVVAVQRSGTTTFAGPNLSQVFKDAVNGGTITLYTDATAGADMVNDTYLYNANTSVRYMNYGVDDSGAPGNVPLLFHFNLAELPGFDGALINRAELQLYYTGGNTGPSVSRIITQPWAEGNKNAGYPGVSPAAAGASYAHPRGLNTAASQDADGGTTGPLGSWGLSGDQIFSTAADVSGVTYGGAYGFNYSGIGYTGVELSYDGHSRHDITFIAQAWADGDPNYGLYVYNGNMGFVFAEGGGIFQPVLFVDYVPNEVPNAISDLAASNPDWFKVDLTWTAPDDIPSQPCASYDIRYSTSPIDAGNFNSATQVANPPLPDIPGTVQTFSVTGLNASTTYYFAIKAIDVTAKVSAISNVVSATTDPMDTTAPADVTTLAVADTFPNHVTLSWTAVGDNGTSGTANTYDIRYSTSAINASNFASATQVPGEPTPAAAGAAESMNVFGLSASTTYYFAMKVADEVPNWSGLSNVVSTTTDAPDTSAPNAVSDLAVGAVHIKTLYLNWSAPADVGTAGVGSYDIRYSTSTISEGNWSSATPLGGSVSPGEPGSPMTVMVSGLNPDTTYYFAMKSTDLAAPPNTSALSNVASGTTMPPVAPVTVQNPWLVSDRVADTHNISTMGATYVNAYTPDGVVAPTSDEDKAINIYNNQKRRLYHWAVEPPNGLGTSIDDPTYVQNIYGWALCGRHASQACTIVNAAGLTPRKIGIPGHWVYEVKYSDGTYHFYDTMTTCYVYDRGSPAKVASLGAIQSDNSLITDAQAEGRACPGFLLCGDSPSFFCNGYSPGADGSGVVTGKWTGNMNLRMGEAFERTWEAWQNQHPTSTVNADSDPGYDPPYHHEAQHDWKDTVNWPYWEPYTLYDANIISTKSTYRRWANGTYDLAPDFRSGGYAAMLHSSTNIATFNDDAMTPDLHVAAVDTPAEVVFKIDLPYYITDCNLSGSFYKHDSLDVTKIHFSADGASWYQVWENVNTGTTELSNLNLRDRAFGKFSFYIKIEMQAGGSITDVGVSDLVISTIFLQNKGAMAYLDKGTNNITFTFDNPQDLSGGGAAIRIAYLWKEYDGSDWSIDRSYETYVTTSPANFTINVGGTKVPRTESIVIEVCEPPMPDANPPAPITDLAAVYADSTLVDLTWTAVGDDWDVGQANSYDVRYSTSPINEGNWASATQATGEPAPQLPGSAEAFTVTGLTPNTTYYFAVKTLDEGGNAAAISNVVSATTGPPDLTAPAAITDLAAAVGSASGSVDLTWTAPGDDGSVGTARTYDIRYSTSAIDDTNFASATAATGVPAPQAAGSAESFTITGLPTGVLHYFAIKTSDEVPNVSAISNVVSLTPQLGEKTLQNGLDGYTGTLDTYITASNPDNNYGGYERMIVTGYADPNPANRQRGVVKFDLSSIASNATITNATLYLYSYDDVQRKGSTGYYGVYRATGSWSPGTATWNSPWTTAGGDFEATPDGTAPKQGVAGVWYAFNVTNRVQQWIADGSTNYGWIVKCTDENLNNQDYFYQSDTANGSYRPKLVITDAGGGDPDTTAPAAITDLSAVEGTAIGSVDLAWTAPGDDGTTGTARTYEIRYSTSTITEGNWASATQVGGVPFPQTAGSAESFTVTGLGTGQTYYFAIKTSDEVPNVSAISNVASATPMLGERVFQEGLDGYTGTADTYLSASNTTNNYDTYERMVVTGYADSDPANRQRGLVKFDLTSIPTNASISRATLYLYSYDAAQVKGSTGEYGAYPVTTAWAAGTATWASPWTTAGGDFAATADATASKQAVAGVWYAFDVTSRVQQWIATPASNLGWLIRCTDENLRNQDYFYQSDAASASYRPKLVVTDTGGFTITTLSSPTAGGSVTGGGAYESGQQCTLTASPATQYGYTFVQWSGGSVDGQTANPASFTVVGDETITAVFQGPAGVIDVTTFAELKNAIQNQATPGTTIRVHPGTYPLVDANGRLSLNNAGTVGDPITVIGMMDGNQRPILEPAVGQEVNRGYFHIWPADSNWVFENLEFRNLRGQNILYSPNAAAAYIQGDNITFRNCVIHNCDQGFASTLDSDNVLIEYCEIYSCGSDLNLGYAHLMYMMSNSLTVRGCYLHDAYGGMCFKSRSAHLVMEYNWLENDGSEAFVASIASNNTSNSLWRGNVLIKRSTSGGQRRILSLYDNAVEGLSGTVTLINNTFISALSEDIYIHHVSGSAANLVLKNNIFAGPSNTLLDWNVPYSQLSGTNNVFKNAMNPVPTELVNNTYTDAPGFVNLAARDLHLLDTSPCVNVGQNSPTWLNASSVWVDGTPQYEPTKLLATDSRFADATLDAGAYEYRPPVPAVSFDLATSGDSEAITAASLGVSLSESYSDVVTVDYAVTGGTATGGGIDYTLAAGQVTFNIGQTIQSIPVTIVDDALDEDDETIVVTLSNPTNAVLGAITTHTYTITDNDLEPTVQFAAAASQGDESVANVNLEVTLSAASGRTVTVDYAATGGTATGGGTDYSISGTQLTFSPGQTSQSVPITVVDDALSESAETIEVSLSNAVNAALGATTLHTYTILDNELPTAQFELTSSSGDEATSPANLVVTLDRIHGSDVTIEYNVTGGTAVEGTDFTMPSTPTSGIVALKRSPGATIDRGLASQFQNAIAASTLDVYSGTGMAADTHYYLSLTWAQDNNYRNYGGYASITYGNWPIFSKFNIAALPGFAGSTINKAQLRFYYSGGNTGLTSTGYITSSDWIEGTGTPAYPGAAGGLSAAHPMGYNTGPNQDADGGTTGPLQTWANNDYFAVAKDVSASAATVSKYGYNAIHTYGGFAVYDVTDFVQDMADGTVPNYGFCTYSSTLNYSVQFSETTHGADYQPVLFVDYTSTTPSNSVTITAGNLTASIPVTIIDDAVVESDETIEVTLSNPTNAVLGANTVHTYTIYDNDHPTVEFDLTSSSGDEGTTPASLAVSLSHTSTEVVTVDYAVTGGTATGNGTDYLLAAGYLQFNVGQTTQNILLEVFEDLLDEDDETVVVTLSSPVNAVLGSNTAHTYTILDNDPEPTVQFDLTGSSGDEAVTPVWLDVSLDAASGRTVTVNYAVTGGTATGGGVDYTLAAGQLQFTAGQVTQSIQLDVYDDLDDEDDETVVVTLSSPVNAVLGSNTAHTYTIVDNDATYPEVQFDLTYSSGDEGTRDVFLTVSLNQSHPDPVTVDYTLTGTATQDVDYIVGISDIVALKRSAGLTHVDPDGTVTDAGHVDPIFAALTENDVVTTTVADGQIVPGTWADFAWKNFGTTLTTNGGSSQEWGLWQFDLAPLGGVTHVHQAELRLYSAGGNTGSTLSRLLTAWSEGNKDGGFPGATPAATGVSHAHPNGLQTGGNQLADGTPGDTGSWSAGFFSSSDYDMSQGRTAGTWPWWVWDITSIAQTWADGTANNGVVIYNANYSYHFSEADTGKQPVLFMDYTAAVATQTVTFQPGETSKSIPLSVLNDLTYEGNEDVQVTLTNPVNATLGVNTTHVYTILDND